MRKLLILAVAAAASVSGPQGVAFAQDASCGCVVRGAQSASLGTIQASEGRVVILGASGPRQGTIGQSLRAADRVATSVQSSAVVLAGGCQVALAGEQELRFERQGDNLCVAVSDVGGVATTGQVQQQAASGTPAWLLPVGATVLIGGAVIAVATSDSDNKVSQ